MRMIVLITYTGKTLLLLLHILYLHTSVRKKKEKVTAREGQDLKVCTSRIAGSTLLIRRPKVAVDLQIAGQAAVVDFGSKQVGSPGPVAAVARLGQATARAVAVAEAEAEAVGCLGQAAAELGLVVVVVVGGAAVGAEAEAEAEAVCLGRAAVGAEAVGLGLAAAAAQAEAAGLAAAACFDHDVPPGSCQARLPLQAIRLQGEVAAAAAGPGEGTTTVGASPWLELEVVVDWWSWCLSA
jgi:hypothetical protein